MPIYIQCRSRSPIDKMLYFLKWYDLPCYWFYNIRAVFSYSIFIIVVFSLWGFQIINCIKIIVKNGFQIARIDCIISRNPFRVFLHFDENDFESLPPASVFLKLHTRFWNSRFYVRYIISRTMFVGIRFKRKTILTITHTQDRRLPTSGVLEIIQQYSKYPLNTSVNVWVFNV